MTILKQPLSETDRLTRKRPFRGVDVISKMCGPGRAFQLDLERYPHGVRSEMGPVYIAPGETVAMLHFPGRRLTTTEILKGLGAQASELAGLPYTTHQALVVTYPRFAEFLCDSFGFEASAPVDPNIIASNYAMRLERTKKALAREGIRLASIGGTPANEIIIARMASAELTERFATDLDEPVTVELNLEIPQPD